MKNKIDTFELNGKLNKMKLWLIFYGCCITCLFGQMDESAPAVITQLTTEGYKCMQGPVYITGVGVDAIKCKGDCYKDGGTVFFDKKSFNLVSYGGSLTSENYEPLEYTNDGISVSFLLSRVRGSNYGDGWEVLWRSEKSILNDNENYRLEYGFRYISPSSYQGASGYSMSIPASNAFFGVALTKIDEKGSIVWTQLFPRSIYGWTHMPEVEAAPYIIQKDSAVYLFYVDRSANFEAKGFNEMHFGGSFAPLGEKYDLVCVKFSAIDGSFQKYFISRKRNTRAMFYLYQPIVMDDGSFAILGQTKNSFTFGFYQLRLK